MGKATGFLEYKRKTAPYRSVKTRLKDYKDVVQYLDSEEVREQAARCMDCGIPFCHCNGCPVFNLIPEWNDLVYKGHWKEALERLEMTNTMPEITGRICPAPCETSCTLSINDSPVTIKQIELTIIEKGFKEGWVNPKPPKKETHKKAAIIGSGPAGLSAAQKLRRYGHEVVVFEKSDRIGGLLRYGIPDFKLEKWVIDRRLDLMKAEGVKFETDVNIGEDLSARYLNKTFDVILITSGAGEPRDLPIPGRELNNIYFAMEYLSQSNKFVAGDLKGNKIISAKGKNVLVIGGGDTGSDCIGTANRQGAKKVFQFEIMPKPKEWKEGRNPMWPEWPLILRTSSSHQEGVKRDWSILTKKFNGKNNVKEIECVRVEWNKNKENGRFEMKEIPGTDFKIKVDLVFLAMGFVHVQHTKLLKDLGVKFDERDNIKTDDTYKTSVKGVFAAGDSDTGASLVVRAIYHGITAADKIDQYLKKNYK